MDRIENPSYLAGRPAFREYLISNPWIAKRKKINTFLLNKTNFLNKTNLNFIVYKFTINQEGKLRKYHLKYYTFLKYPRR